MEQPNTMEKDECLNTTTETSHHVNTETQKVDATQVQIDIAAPIKEVNQSTTNTMDSNGSTPLKGYFVTYDSASAPVLVLERTIFDTKCGRLLHKQFIKGDGSAVTPFVLNFRLNSLSMVLNYVETQNQFEYIQRLNRTQLEGLVSDLKMIGDQDAVESLESMHNQIMASQIETETQELNWLTESGAASRAIESQKVKLQRLTFEKNFKSIHASENKEFAFNLLIVGVTGTGKSSSLNTIMDDNVCMVSGSQAQGTRGTLLRHGNINNQQFVSFIDTQGLGADTNVTDDELLAQIMLATESVFQMKVINNIIISFDMNSRTTPATMANQLTLMELFTDLKPSCFLCFTKWNTNPVMHDWNRPLKDWVRKYRRVRSIEEIDQDPPSYEEMYEAYCNYIVKSMANEEDGGAFSKMGTFLAFFESRVLWMYNLDAVQQEDREDGCLEPHVERMYTFYREKALQTLLLGATRIETESLSFLKSDQDTMQSVAKSLIECRDAKISQLELCGLESEKREELVDLFTQMTDHVKINIAKSNYQVGDFIDKLGSIVGLVKSVSVNGCMIQ